MSQDGKIFELHRVYIKDLSFECPAAADPRPVDSKVAMEVSVNAEHRQRENDGLWDVTIGLTLRVSDSETGETHFIIEATQGGLFGISGVSDEERVLLLATDCREALYPFLRTLFWSIGGQAGLKGMLIKSMDFDELFQRARSSAAPAGSADNG